MEVKETSKNEKKEKEVSSLATESSILKKEISEQIEKSGVEEKVSSEEVQNCEELKPSKDHVGSIKDSLFNTENMQSLFNSPIFDTFVKIICGLHSLHGEPLTFFHSPSSISLQASHY